MRLFFYGKDQRLEKAYASLESLFASALEKLKTGNINLSKEEDSSVKLFMVFQWNRTPEAVEKIDEFMTQSLKELVKNSSMFDSKIKSHIDYLKMKLTQPHDFLFGTSMDIAYTLADLKLSLIENKDETFVIGQSPVCVLNPLLYEIKYEYGLSGLGEKGAVVLMPISPRYIVVLYDSLSYRLIKENGIIVPSEKDINLFNYCQFLKTTECIYFKKGNIKEFIKLNAKSKSFREDIAAYARRVNISDDNKKYAIFTSYKDFPFPQIFDCIKIKECAFMSKMEPMFDVARPAVRVIQTQIDNLKQSRRIKKNN